MVLMQRWKPPQQLTFVSLFLLEFSTLKKALSFRKRESETIIENEVETVQRLHKTA